MQNLVFERFEQQADFKTDKYEIGHTSTGLLFWRSLSSSIYHYTSDINEINEKLGAHHV